MSPGVFVVIVDVVIVLLSALLRAGRWMKVGLVWIGKRGRLGPKPSFVVLLLFLLFLLFLFYFHCNNQLSMLLDEGWIGVDWKVG